MTAPDIVDLAAAKAQVNITDSSSDTELAGFISAVTAVVERHVGAVIHRSVTEVFDGGRPVLLLTATPVVSITSVTESGGLVDPSGYTFAAASGVLTRVAGTAQQTFLQGIQSVSVTYVAGQAANTAAVPGHVRLGALVILQHLWETQRPAARGPFSQDAGDFDPRYTYSIPRRALELLGVPRGGIA